MAAFRAFAPPSRYRREMTSYMTSPNPGPLCKEEVLGLRGDRANVARDACGIDWHPDYSIKPPKP